MPISSMKGEALALTAVEEPPSASCNSISYGFASDNSSKGEDHHAAITRDPRKAAFGVFDGHSGGGAAWLCADKLLAKLDVCGMDPESITSAFWELDDEVGVVGIDRSGTTATVLLVEEDDVDGGMRCLLAWAGDSTALRFDIANTSAFQGIVARPTVDHSPTQPAEVAFLQRLSSVRVGVEQRGEPLAEAVALALGGRDPSPSERKLFERALRRAERISTTLRTSGSSGCDGTAGDGEDGATLPLDATVLGRERAAAVRNAYVIQRPPRSASSNRWKRRPTVVATALQHENPVYYDVAMTRSIGDWHGPDMVVPHPQLEAFSVPAAKRTRVILASDGLWDVCEHESAVRLARECASPQEAAEALLTFAQREYAARGKKGVGDDVTIYVVDLNPSGLSFRPPAKSAYSHCCSGVHWCPVQ